jgi:POT family proton-dependent oligopeptide transporter
MASDASALPAHLQKAFFGHPRGLSTLFFTEMWERFSYYGVRTLLVLYMTSSVENHGLGLSVGVAGAIYGLFTSCAYIFSLPTGWIADRFLGHRKAVLLGGLLISLGNFGILIPSTGPFILALLLKAIGTAFLKTSCTTVVGMLYGERDNRRDAGFTLYYVGINVGAFFAPLICGYIGQTYDFRWAFAVSGTLMLVGLGQFVATQNYLGDAGIVPSTPATSSDRKLLWAGSAVLAVTVAALAMLGTPIEAVADGFAALLLIAVLATFGGLIFSPGFTPVERKRIYVILVLFVASALFWGIFEQAGSTLTLFADRSTNNSLFGYDFPSTWFQSLNPILIWVLGPLLAWWWVKSGDRNPSLVTKFAFGLFGAGGGFLLMMLAAQAAGPTGKVSPMWLAGVYLIHTVGELCLSPVGQSAISKLAPARIAGMVMGVWFLSVSVGNFAAGYMARFYESMPLDQLVGYSGAAGVGLGLVLLLISKPITKLMGGVK